VSSRIDSRIVNRIDSLGTESSQLYQLYSNWYLILLKQIWQGIWQIHSTQQELDQREDLRTPETAGRQIIDAHLAQQRSVNVLSLVFTHLQFCLGRAFWTVEHERDGLSIMIECQIAECNFDYIIYFIWFYLFYFCVFLSLIRTCARLREVSLWIMLADHVVDCLRIIVDRFSVYI